MRQARFSRAGALCLSAQGKDKPLAGKVADALESAESESEPEPTASQRGAVEEAQDPLAKDPAAGRVWSRR